MDRSRLFPFQRGKKRDEKPSVPRHFVHDYDDNRSSFQRQTRVELKVTTLMARIPPSYYFFEISRTMEIR